MATTSTRTSRHVNAPRATVYRALLDAGAVAPWLVPMGMTSPGHVFDVREGGLFRISLTDDEPTGTGKTTPQTDTYHGHFVKLVPSEQVVEVTGILGVLLEAKAGGLLSAVGPELDQLMAQGFWLSDAMRLIVLRSAGE